eukprot:gene4971-9943_t
MMNLLDVRIINNTFGITPANEDDRKKFLGFSKYLFDRGKAALIRLDANKSMYIIPASKADDLELQCSIWNSNKQASLPTPSTLSVPSVTPVAKVSKASSASVISTGLLGSLLAQVEETAKTRQPGVFSRPPPEDRLRTLERRLRKQIDDFLEAYDRDGGATVLVLEPMDKEQRFVVHEVMEEFSDRAVAISTGDDDERHVEVFVKGFEPPPDLDMLLVTDTNSIQTVKSRGQGCRSKGTGTGTADSTARPVVGSIIRVNQVKRDRRTIEEIQQTLKKRKEDDNF